MRMAVSLPRLPQRLRVKGVTRRIWDASLIVKRGGRLSSDKYGLSSTEDFLFCGLESDGDVGFVTSWSSSDMVIL